MKKRLLAMIMTLAMCLSLLPTAAFATETWTDAQRTQDSKQIKGSYYAYDASSKTFEATGSDDAVVKNNKENTKVTISKTIAPTGTENQFDITLNVKTSEFVEETNPDTNAAVVLVMDISQSMDLCAECGSKNREQKPIKKMKDGIEVCANTNCSAYEKSFVSRMDAAKKAADDFLRSYAGFEGETYTDPGASRYVSIVAYGKNTNTIVVGWQDIHKATQDATNDALNTLKAEIAAFDNNVVMSYQDRCGTNTDAGLKQAEEELGENTINGINNKFVVLLTDGEPSATAQNKLSGNGYTLPSPYPSGYNGNQYEYPAMRAMHIRTVEKAMFYSICFGAGDTVSTWMDSFSDKCVNADNSRQLKVAFNEILIRMMLGVYAWKVTDPMGEYITYVNYDDNPRHAANAVSFNSESKTLVWDLSEDLKGATTVIKDDKDNVVTYDNYKASDGLNCTVEYTLTYRVSLDVAAMVAKKQDMEEYVLTNGATSLAYYLTQTDSDGNVKYLNDEGKVIPDGNEKLLTMYFKVPKVRGYAGDLSFAKVDEENAPLAGATFTLTGTNGFEESETSVDVEEGAETNKNVTISGIPSGATYTLKETDVPEGYQENSKEYTVEVNYGVATLKDGRDVITQIQNTLIPPPEPTTGTLIVTKMVKGLDTLPANFAISVTKGDTEVQSLIVSEATKAENVYTWTLTDVELGTYSVTESNYEVDGYNVVKTGDGSNVTVVAGQEASLSLTNTYTAKAPNLSAEKSAPATVTPGGTITYTINVTNSGDAAANGVVITDVIPAGLEFVSATEGGINNAGTVTWNIASIGAANAADDTDQKTVSVTVKVPESAANGTKYENTAVVNGGNTNKTTTVVDNLSASIGGTKVVKQGGNVAAPAEEFTFNLSLETVNGQAPEQAYTQTVSAVAGPFSFSPIKYTEPGTYVYKVSETKGSAADWTYDSTVYTVTVNVVRNDGKLAASVPSYVVGNGEAEVNAITFTNTYTKNQSTGGGGGIHIPDKPPALNKVDHFAYIVGYPDGNVMPNGNITRAEVATIFFRMLTDESRDEFWSQSSDYSDVTATKWFNNAVCTLSNGGIINGYADGTFKPNGNITRAEFATMAVRFFSASYEGESLFPDIDQHWAKDYINTAAYEGLINGYEDGTFRPNQPITRAEAMAIVNRVLDRHPDKANLLEDMIQWPDNMDTEKWYYADVQEATNSHDYDMEGTEAEPYEVWTEILPVRDWVAFEKEWSDSNSAEGGEVMK